MTPSPPPSNPSFSARMRGRSTRWTSLRGRAGRRGPTVACSPSGPMSAAKQERKIVPDKHPMRVPAQPLILTFVLVAAACTSSPADTIAGDSAGAPSTAAVAPSTVSPTTGLASPTTPTPPDQDDSSTPLTEPPNEAPQTQPLEPVVDAGPVADSLLLIRTSAPETDVVKLEVRDRNGALVTDLTETSAGRSFLPTWSTDGRWIAWAQLGDSGEWTLVVTDIAGNRRSESPLAGRPDYLAFEDWNPEPADSATEPAIGPRIYALVGAPTGFGMVSLDPINGLPDFEVARGAPLFFDQAPNSPLVAIQVNDRTAVIDASSPSGAVTELRRGRVTSVLPIWNPVDANEVLFAESNDGSAGGVLQRHDLAAGINSPVLAYGAGIQLDPSPNGDRLAVVIRPSFGGVDDPFNDPDAISVVFVTSDAEDDPTKLPTLDEAGLWAVDATTGAAELLTARRSTIAQWDPTSNWAVVLHANGAQPPTWAAYGPADVVVETPPIALNSAAGSYLAFWDQFSQNHSMWSSDGSEFVFTGAIDGADGVWLQALDQADPTFVSAGSTAFFSPT